MKRHVITAVVIGLVVGGLIIGLEISGFLLRLDLAVSGLLPETSTKLMSALHYALALIAAGGVAFLTLAASRRGRMGLIVGVLVVEFIGIAWVASLFRVEFHPLPVMAAALLGYLASLFWIWLEAYLEERRSRPPKIKAGPTPRPAPISVVPETTTPTPAPVVAPQPVVAAPPPVVEKPRARARRSDTPGDSGARVCEVTAVVCDLANKHDLAEECEPAEFADITERFIAHAVQAFRGEGAYIESAGGEGVVAIFGFPESDKQHAEKATRRAMALTQSFLETNKASKSDAVRNTGVHAGVSSGTMIMAPLKNNGQRTMLAAGEPVELARRFCIANRFYGSRVLLGPRTFELASKILVARPIDFLSGVDVRERHEIYEPVALALNASREVITRRDAFWNGVVLYREKRWAEAYSQFQNARGPEGEEDRPLQLYLRRLEPLALQLTSTPLDQ
jgi:class 3 adenylate cyclase